MPLDAQGLFSPAYVVNERVVTNFELEQRAQLLEIIQAPGDPFETANRELVNDRLRQQALDEAGLIVAEEDIAAGFDQFAQQANLSGEELVLALEEAGIAVETFRDFIAIQIGWREYVAARFLSRARPSEEEIDRALGQSGGYTVQVLLSELIMPITEQNFAQVEEIANQVAQTTSFDTFSASAAQYSAAESRLDGGRLGWLSLSNLPSALRPTLLSLKPGEVSPPLRLQNALALFQMRGIREASTGAVRYAAIEYAQYYIAGGRTPEALAAAQKVVNQVDTCDDLYGVAQDLPPEVLVIESKAPGEIPQDIAIELAKLDPGETSTAVTRNNGQTLVVLMLCSREGQVSQDASREEIAQALTQQRLSAYADSYLAQLRAESIIVQK
jgi:peptidyl-prolyl cis-trans isomerase SurA